VVTEQQVVNGVHSPEYVDTDLDPPMAQKVISERHMIRVVFVEDASEILIMTFYPRSLQKLIYERNRF
jgi:hypothetical protein